MDILVIKLSALGDVLRTTSLLRPLRRRHPRCRIWWMTTPAAAPLLKGNPWIDRVVELDPRAAPAARLEDELKDRFDLVLSLEEDPVSTRIAMSACRDKFVGVYPEGEGLSYTASSARYYDMSLLNRDEDGGLKKANRLKAANRLTYARLWLKVLGLPAPKKAQDLRPVLRLTAADRRAAKTFSRRHGLKTGKPIGLNPGAGKRWPAKQLAEGPAAALAADLVRRHGRDVILFGGRDETERNRRIVKRAKRLLGSGSSGSVLDAGTRHDLRSFAGLIELCGLVVATDSLALHIATALGRQAVVLIGPTSAAELETFGRGAKVVPPKGCPCFYRSRCRFKTNCLDRMGSAPVTRAVGRCLR